MHVVSSHKPSKDSAQVAINQWRANQTWKQSFDSITYFGEPENSLSGKFIPSEQWPRILDIVKYCCTIPGWSAIVNADIVVPAHFRKVEALMVAHGAKAVVSRRWEFKGENLKDIRVVDLGLDFFAADRTIWEQVAMEFHPSLRIGHNTWDSHMLGILNAKAGSNFYDITTCRCVLHPKHGDRKQVYEIDSQLPGYRPIFPRNSINLFYDKRTYSEANH